MERSKCRRTYRFSPRGYLPASMSSRSSKRTTLTVYSPICPKLRSSRRLRKTMCLWWPPKGNSSAMKRSKTVWPVVPFETLATSLVSILTTTDVPRLKLRSGVVAWVPNTPPDLGKSRMTWIRRAVLPTQEWVATTTGPSSCTSNPIKRSTCKECQVAPPLSDRQMI